MLLTFVVLWQLMSTNVMSVLGGKNVNLVFFSVFFMSIWVFGVITSMATHVNLSCRKLNVATGNQLYFYISFFSNASKFVAIIVVPHFNSCQLCHVGNWTWQLKERYLFNRVNFSPFISSASKFVAMIVVSHFKSCPPVMSEIDHGNSKNINYSVASFFFTFLPSQSIKNDVAITVAIVTLPCQKLNMTTLNSYSFHQFPSSLAQNLSP